MLALTEGAAEAIRQLTEIPTAEGMRISAGPGAVDGSEAGLRIELAAAPDDEDTVLEADGAQLFLEPTALAILDEKVLDADVSEGQVQFAVLEQTEGGGEPA